MTRTLTEEIYWGRKMTHLKLKKPATDKRRFGMNLPEFARWGKKVTGHPPQDRLLSCKSMANILRD